MSLTVNEKARRLSLYRKGLTDSEMATELHLAPNTVQTWRKKAGLKFNEPKQELLSLDEAIINQKNEQICRWLEELRDRREKMDSIDFKNKCLK